MKEAGKQGCRKLLTGVTLLTGMTLLASASFAAGPNADTSAQIQERLERVEQSIRQVLPPSQELQNLESQLYAAKDKGDDAAVTHLQAKIDELQEDLLKKAAGANDNLKILLQTKKILSEQLAHSEGTASVAAAVIQPAAADGTGSISGVVTNSAGKPVSGVTVTAKDTKDPANKYSATTGTDGAYTIEGVGADDYQLYFSAPEGYVSEWYEDAPQDACATPVTLDADNPDAADINTVLAKESSISGTVKGADGSALAGVQVCPSGKGSSIDIDGNYTSSYLCANTDSDGKYTIKGLAADSYIVTFYAPADSGLLSEYYNNATDWSSAERVVLAAEAAKTGIDAQLEKGGSIAGTVTDGTSDLDGVSVKVYECYDATCDYMSYYPSSSTSTDANGEYTIDTLPMGKYKVLFDAPTDLADQWYNNKADFGSATVVEVTTASLDKTGVDAELTVGNSISGTVTDDADPANPLLAEVTLYPCLNAACTSYDYSNTPSTTTDAATGNYTFANLPTGANYKVKFAGPTGFADQWYDNKTYFGNATVIALTADKADIDAVLTAGGSIGGTVTDDATTPKPVSANVNLYICTTATCDSWSYDRDVNSDGTTGEYTFANLPIGAKFKVQFYEASIVPSLATQWYNNKADGASADVVEVTEPPKTDINAKLAAMKTGTGKITGTVTNHGAPFKCANVEVYDADYSWIDYEYADYQGKYEVKDLPTGAYKVYAGGRDVLSGAWYWQWYKCKDSFDKAKTVNVTSPDATTVDIKFPCGASILPALYPLLMNRQ